MAVIQKRAQGTWLVRIFMGRDGRGRQQFINKTIRGTKKDAQKWLTETQRRIDLGEYVEPSRMTLDEYLDKWLETAARPRVSERTFYDYKANLERYVRPMLGRKHLHAIQPLDVQKLYGAMQDRNLAAKTIRYAHMVISSALKQAVKWRIIASNPAAMVDLPKDTRQEMRALAPAEATKFIEEARADRHGIVFIFALATGMRPEEYLGLQWTDIDLSEGTATVRRALCWYRAKGGGWYFTEPKTKQSRRTIPLPFSIVRELSDHRRRQAEERLRLGSKYHNHGLVFAAELGTPLNLDNLRHRHFKPILKRAELPASIRVYDLRHSCATLLLGAGENPKVVSERLGHASIVLTLDTYSHVLPSMQKAAAEKLDGLLFGTLRHDSRTG